MILKTHIVKTPCPSFDEDEEFHRILKAFFNSRVEQAINTGEVIKTTANSALTESDLPLDVIREGVLQVRRTLEDLNAQFSNTALGEVSQTGRLLHIKTNVEGLTNESQEAVCVIGIGERPPKLSLFINSPVIYS